MKKGPVELGSDEGEGESENKVINLIFGCKKNDGQGSNFRLKYLDVEKMRDKVPKSLMT